MVVAVLSMVVAGWLSSWSLSINREGRVVVACGCVIDSGGRVIIVMVAIHQWRGQGGGGCVIGGGGRVVVAVL